MRSSMRRACTVLLDLPDARLLARRRGCRRRDAVVRNVSRQDRRRAKLGPIVPCLGAASLCHDRNNLHNLTIAVENDDGLSVSRAAHKLVGPLTNVADFDALHGPKS